MKKVKKSAKVFSANADKVVELNEGDYMKAYKGHKKTVYVDYTITEKDIEYNPVVKYVAGSTSITCLARFKLKEETMAKFMEFFKDHYNNSPKFEVHTESYFSETFCKYIDINFRGCKKEETRQKKIQEALDAAYTLVEGSLKEKSAEAFINNINHRIKSANEIYVHETVQLLDSIRADYITEMAGTADLEKEVEEAQKKLLQMKQDLKLKKNLAILKVLEDSNWVVDGVEFTEEVKEKIREKANKGGYFNTSGFFHC